MIAALIARFGGLDGETLARLTPLLSPLILNWNGAEVGLVRPAGPLG